MKNFLIAVILGIVLVSCFGSIIDDFWGLNIVFADDFLTPSESLIALAGVAVLFVIVGFVVAISVIGTLVIGAGAAILAVLAVGISALWPLLVVIAIVYFVRRGGRQQVHG